MPQGVCCRSCGCCCPDLRGRQFQRWRPSARRRRCRRRCSAPSHWQHPRCCPQVCASQQLALQMAFIQSGIICLCGSKEMPDPPPAQTSCCYSPFCKHEQAMMEAIRCS